MRLSFLFFLPLLCGFQITEIMYDPQGNDNNREYIEVFLNGSNLTDAIIEDLRSSDTLMLLQEGTTDYALIVEENYIWNSSNATVYTVGATIGNGLNNDKDLVLLRLNETILDASFYISSRDGGQNNGKALCLSNDVLMECLPTPGEENDLNSSISLTNYTLLISEFLPDPIGEDRAPRPGGEWVELYNYGEEALDLRGLLLQDKRNMTVTISDVHLDTPVLAPSTYGVVYLNGQLLLNNEGLEFVRLATSTKVLDETSYSFSQEGLSWSKDLEEDVFTLAHPTPSAEHQQEEVSLNSSLVLERIYVGSDDVVKFGEFFRVRLHVYKGDTTKTTIKVYVANLSKQTTVSVAERFVDHIFTLTIPLPPNCKGKLSDGIYLVHAEGLDATTTIPVTIKGTSKENCVIVEQNSTRGTLSVQRGAQTSLKSVTSSQLPDSFINDSGRIVYEASDSKARRWAVYFFCFTLLLVIAALLTQDSHDKTQSTRNY